MFNPSERISQSSPTCFQNVMQSRWVEVALFLSVVALITLGLLSNAGLLQFKGSTYFSYAIFTAAGLSALVALTKFITEACSKKNVQPSEEESPPKAPPIASAVSAPLLTPNIEQPKVQVQNGKWDWDLILRNAKNKATFESEPLTEQEYQQAKDFLQYTLLDHPKERGDHGGRVAQAFIKMVVESETFRKNPYDFLAKMDLSPCLAIADRTYREPVKDLIETAREQLFHGIWNMRQKPPKDFRAFI